MMNVTMNLVFSLRHSSFFNDNGGLSEQHSSTIVQARLTGLQPGLHKCKHFGVTALDCVLIMPWRTPFLVNLAVGLVVSCL